MTTLLCPDKEEAEKRTKILGKLKELLERAEQDVSVGIRQIQGPCGGGSNEPPLDPTKPPEKKVQGPPDVMVCYKIPNKNSAKDYDDGIPLSYSRSRELRAGVLYVGCECCKRYGLQDDCPRTECQGSPQCLTKPPSCGPVAYCEARHLQAKFSDKKDKKNSKEVKMKYKCFPATVKPPEVPCCITTCIYDNSL